MKLALIFALLGLVESHTYLPQKFLVISDATNATIGYVRSHDMQNGSTHVKPLVAAGLRNPQGIAIDQKRKVLYVADPDMRQVLSYNLLVSGGELFVENVLPKVAVEAEARWVAVDGLGNLYLTSEADSKVMSVNYQALKDGDKDAAVMYSGISQHPVSAPGGIATDNFHVFWSNKVDGDDLGVLLRAPVYETNGSATRLAHNIPKAYGVCIANNNVYYSDEVDNLYVVKRNGGLPVTVGGNFSSPRGCVWDGDGTVYVADRSQNAVFSFSGPLEHPVPGRPITRAVDAPGAFGLALLTVLPSPTELLEVSGGDCDTSANESSTEAESSGTSSLSAASWSLLALVMSQRL